MAIGPRPTKPDQTAREEVPLAHSLPPFRPMDPLHADHPDDVPYLTTYRRMQRVAIIACEVGARFEREKKQHDPVEWMLSPHLLFSGQPAIIACQDREAYSRATIMHGLSLDLDVDAAAIDLLVRDDCETLSG